MVKLERKVIMVWILLILLAFLFLPEILIFLILFMEFILKLFGKSFEEKIDPFYCEIDTNPAQRKCREQCNHCKKIRDGRNKNKI